MADFLSVQPVTGLGNAVRPEAPVVPPAVAQMADTGSAGSSSDYTNPRHAQDQAAAAQRVADQARKGEKVLTGPPPSFEASLLEVEGQLEAVIRRMEAARERARNDASEATAPALRETADPAQASQAPEQPEAVGSSEPAAPGATEQPELSITAEMPEAAPE